MVIRLRHAEAADYGPIIGMVDDWWGGRRMRDMLPRLFFVHFRPTSFVVEEGGQILGFLVGFLSQTYQEQAHVHFVGVDPGHRGRGIGRMLYDRFFAEVLDLGRSEVWCVTSPVNTGSIAFHRRLGFEPVPGDAEIDGVAVVSDYDGRGEARVVFRRELSTVSYQRSAKGDRP